MESVNKIKNKNNKGISVLGVLLLVGIAILVLSYFNISIRRVIESPEGQDNINYVKGSGKSFWDKYLKEPASYLWHDVAVNIFWRGFISNMERIRDGQPTDFDNATLKIDPTQ